MESEQRYTLSVVLRARCCPDDEYLKTVVINPLISGNYICVKAHISLSIVGILLPRELLEVVLEFAFHMGPYEYDELIKGEQCPAGSFACSILIDKFSIIQSYST
jgi:hypothetical protein